MNPAAKGLVVVSSSEGRILPYGSLEDVLSRDESPKNCHTKDDRNSWFAIDLGLWVYPTVYTLRHARGYGRCVLVLILSPGLLRFPPSFCRGVGEGGAGGSCPPHF